MAQVDTTIQKQGLPDNPDTYAIENHIIHLMRDRPRLYSHLVPQLSETWEKRLMHFYLIELAALLLGILLAWLHVEFAIYIAVVSITLFLAVFFALFFYLVYRLAINLWNKRKDSQSMREALIHAFFLSQTVIFLSDKNISKPAFVEFIKTRKASAKYITDESNNFLTLLGIGGTASLYNLIKEFSKNDFEITVIIQAISNPLAIGTAILGILFIYFIGERAKNFNRIFVLDSIEAMIDRIYSSKENESQ